MKKVFSTKTAQPSCHPDPRLAGFISGSDPSAQGTRCRNEFGMTRGGGFTLAEVLITLGIIGIVAAITIPALIANYQSRIHETNNLVFKNRLGEALRQMNIAGDFHHSDTKGFVDALKKYMKIVQVCEADKLTACFPDKITNAVQDEIVEVKDLMTSSTLNKANWNTAVMGVVLQNGHSMILAYNPNCPQMDIAATSDDLAACISVVYDTNGQKHPNKSGSDLGLIGANPFTCPGGKISGMCVATEDAMASPSLNTCSPGPYYFSGNKWCANDKWAGAIQYCIDQDMRLPNRAEMQALVAAKEQIGLNGEQYWTCEQENAYNAWVIHANLSEETNGNIYNAHKDDHDNWGYKIRCVK